MMKAAAMAHNPPHVHRLRVVGELQVHRDGRPLFQLASQNEAEPCGTEVCRFAAKLNVSAAFEDTDLDRNCDPMPFAAALRFLF